MSELNERALAWIASDPDEATRAELEAIVRAGDVDELSSRMDTILTFGTAGIRGEVAAGPGRMNRAVVIRTTAGLASYLGSVEAPVVVGFDARPTSRQFAEDTTGVLAAAGIRVVFFPEFAPTPLVAFAAKHLGAAAAVVVTASHNPPADNGYKVYGSDASQIVSPVDTEIQEGIDAAPPAIEVPRIENSFTISSELIQEITPDIVNRYWAEVSATRSRSEGSDLRIVYTPIHGVGRDVFLDLMTRAGHIRCVAVPAQAEPDGTFPTVTFPNPEEPGALDLALELATTEDADLVLANDPDADRLAVVLPTAEGFRPLTGNEIGALLGDYVLRHDPDPTTAIVGNSIVSSPLMGLIARSYGATHTRTLTGFKWIVRAGLTLEAEGRGRFVFGYEEALGYTVGSTVRDKDGMSAGVMFSDLTADLADEDSSVLDRLHDLWRVHGLWVSAQVSIVRPGPEGVESLLRAVEVLADDPPTQILDWNVTEVTDYRVGAEQRPPWLGEQALVELELGDRGRMLVRPSGTEPKLKIYIDLNGPVEDDAESARRALTDTAGDLGAALEESLVV